MKGCIVNIGLYRTGTSTLASAARNLSLNVYRAFFQDENPNVFKDVLFDPTKAIQNYLASDENRVTLLESFANFDFVCDGWFGILAFASNQQLESLIECALKRGVKIIFIATERADESYLKSELHNWVLYDLEERSNLSHEERIHLEARLLERKENHQSRIRKLYENGLVKIRMDVGSVLSWSKSLQKISKLNWKSALASASFQNSSPRLPIMGVLLTFRLSKENVEGMNALLVDLQKDKLSNCHFILALDHDDYESNEVENIKNIFIENQLSFRIISNEKRSFEAGFPICKVWHNMAAHAWKDGADWVVLLGDDIRIECSYYYREIYRSFLNIRRKHQLPEDSFFGCPWFNDDTFQGFPTFPIVGRDHFQIFGGLIPKIHSDLFVNQDLDPYLSRLYLKFGASPQLYRANLCNKQGGSNTSEARYARISAVSWRDKVLLDTDEILHYLEKITLGESIRDHVNIVLDIVIPSYRVKLDYLIDIVNLDVPKYMCSTFIIIIDSPSNLLCAIKDFSGSNEVVSVPQATRLLENYLIRSSRYKNNIRVRCNKENLGASATRNHGISESSAEYILFLDDDVIPDSNLLQEYGKALLEQERDGHFVLGLVGLVEFPRPKDLPVIHAGVLMSYLTFMFEIANNSDYNEPAWGVTANILFRNVAGMQFDTSYAKTGGGEDVDFALTLSKMTGGLKLKSCPSARVTHLFWEGGIIQLSNHFFNWAIGDGALYFRFQDYTIMGANGSCDRLVYYSYPNLVEIFVFVIIPFSVQNAIFVGFGTPISSIFRSGLLMGFADLMVDLCWNWGLEVEHRISLLHRRPNWFYILIAHLLANFYVIVLEFGRLYGHLKRYQIINLCRRFDWHCGRHPKAQKSFILREKVKFILFIAVLKYFA